MPRIRPLHVHYIALPRSLGKHFGLCRQTHLSAINSKSIAILTNGFIVNARK